MFDFWVVVYVHTCLLAVVLFYKSTLLRVVCTCHLIRCFCQSIDYLLRGLIHLTKICSSLRGLIHLVSYFACLGVLYALRWFTLSFVHDVCVYGAQLWPLLSKYACLFNSYSKRIFVRYIYMVPTFTNIPFIPDPLNFPKSLGSNFLTSSMRTISS